MQTGCFNTINCALGFALLDLIVSFPIRHQ